MVYGWIPRAARIGGLLLSGLVAGCGGGGGDSADTGLQLTLSTSQLNLSVRSGAPIGTGGEAISATASGGTGNENLFIGAEINGVGIVTPITVVIDPVSRTGRAEVLPDPNLPVGRYSGTLRLLACLDPACAAQVRGSPFTVNYTVDVTPRLSASTDALDFAMVESGAVAAQNVTVVLPDGVAQASATVTHATGPSGWLQVTRQGTPCTVPPA